MSGAVTLSWGAESDRGLRRAANEDSFLAEPPLFLVADGMGGHDAGADASRAAIDGFRPLAGRDSVTVEEIQTAFAAAARGVGSIETQRSAAGTTLTGVAICEQGGVSYWLVLNIGDSRTYRLAGGRLEQISVDHSAVQALVDRGDLAPEAAETHPERNVVTRAVGAGSTGAPDYWLLPAHAGDRVMVCSDGLSKELGFTQIEAALVAEASPQAAATRLLHEALLQGGRDNVTVVVVDAHTVIEADEDRTLPGGGSPDEPEEDTVPRAPRVREGDAVADV
ncbi:MAG: protein phosphatase 2C domain-containing protein [Microbacterium sp.]|uniref:PP2C family protein-serine/threonine phosphatase n=1 Tax=Microbacterium sp. TaxID=51671 RepID=UPI00261CA8F1|nr:protein phosphatase 2C domain-containing protein [Microbacterium sp.]MCX6501567.1 protein phosphatase 2C domain-containing protein [Microbacterium sp.]